MKIYFFYKSLSKLIIHQRIHNWLS